MVTLLESLLCCFFFVLCWVAFFCLFALSFCTYQIFIACRRKPRNFDLIVMFLDNLWFIDNRPLTENIHRIHFSTFCFSFICTCKPYIQVEYVFSVLDTSYRDCEKVSFVSSFVSCPFSCKDTDSYLDVTCAKYYVAC